MSSSTKPNMYSEQSITFFYKLNQFESSMCFIKDIKKNVKTAKILKINSFHSVLFLIILSEKMLNIQFSIIVFFRELVTLAKLGRTTFL